MNMRRARGVGLVESECRVLAAVSRLNAGGHQRWSVGEVLVELADLFPDERMLNEATAYRIASRFSERKWVECTWRMPGTPNERPRREYWLTPEGVVAAAEAVSDFAERHPRSWLEGLSLANPTG